MTDTHAPEGEQPKINLAFLQGGMFWNLNRPSVIEAADRRRKPQRRFGEQREAK